MSSSKIDITKKMEMTSTKSPSITLAICPPACVRTKFTIQERKTNRL